MWGKGYKMPCQKSFCMTVSQRTFRIIPAKSAVTGIPNKPRVSTAPFSSIVLHLSVHGEHPGKRVDLLLHKTFCAINLFTWSTLFPVTMFVDGFSLFCDGTVTAELFSTIKSGI